MSIVVLAEKPSVAEDIAKMLNISKKEATHWSGEGIVVTWAVGHMLELKYMDDYNPDFKNWRKRQLIYRLSQKNSSSSQNQDLLVNNSLL
jgi:DNA topoisomerase-3